MEVSGNVIDGIDEINAVDILLMTVNGLLQSNLLRNIGQSYTYEDSADRRVSGLYQQTYR